MSDELDVNDFFLQKAGNTESMFIQTDELINQDDEQSEFYDSGKCMTFLL